MTNKVKALLIVFGISAVVTTGVILFKKKKKIKEVTDGSGNTIQLNDVQSAIITEANRWVGQEEIEGNNGFVDKAFEKKMRAIGWKEPNPYCAAFVKLVMTEISSGAAKTFFTKNLTLGAEQNFINLSKKNDYAEKIQTPEAGCIVCYKHHNEICESFDGNMMTVISANGPLGNGKTYPSGRSVEGVAKKARKPNTDIDVKTNNTFLGYIRIKKIS
ncbi:MAG: hypothetical protein IJ150_01355 [Bacteroidales bacterium]|nr:hypothetical protein [Bacteroidales bacterium]